MDALRVAVAALPQGSLAILPPAQGGEAWTIAQRVGLAKRAAVLNGDQMVSPGVFNARRFPVALYVAAEDYVCTVRQPGDAAAAVERYVREGGTLVILPTQPWPFYYANDPGGHHPEPLTEKLGLPLFMAIEAAPDESLAVRVSPAQSLVKAQQAEFAFPQGDPRLRSIEGSRLPGGAKYTPIATVFGQSGKSYGDAAGLVELPGGGRILYVTFNLTRDSEHGPAFCEGALRFVLAAAKPRGR